MSAAAATVTAECRGCKSAKKRSQRLGIWVSCDLCKEQYFVAPGAKLADQEAGKHPITLNRAISITGADMTLLSKWTRRVYGGAASLEPMIRGEGGGKQEDERVNEWHRAMEVHRYFEVLKRVDKVSYEVIWFVYLQRTGGTATGMGYVLGEVAELFADPKKRAIWKAKKKTANHVALRTAGKTLHDNAVMAYARLRQAKST